jgi:Outer membrane protein beta-barrel domain
VANKKEGFIVSGKTVVLASFVALAASAAWAQDHRFEVGVMAGWTQSDGVNGNAVRAGDGLLYNSIGPKDSFGYSLNLGYFATENVEVGGLFSQQKSTMTLGGTINRDLGDWSVDNYHGYVAYNSGDAESKARFYFLGGLGATHYGSVSFTSVAGASLKTGGETQFSTTWGAGVKLYPSTNFGVKIGARWTPTYIKSDAAGWWCDPYWGC